MHAGAREVLDVIDAVMRRALPRLTHRGCDLDPLCPDVPTRWVRRVVGDTRRLFVCHGCASWRLTNGLIADAPTEEG
jgi:hypothetical protein